MDMKTVAFLQNMWVRDPQRVRDMIARSEQGERLRRMLIARALFAGCLTGRQLKRELGNHCDGIVWEESSREILGDPKIVPRADLEHMMKTVALEKPALVLTFGRVAGDAYDSIQKYLQPSPFWIRSPHPAARSPVSKAEFRHKMQEVLSLYI